MTPKKGWPKTEVARIGLLVSWELFPLNQVIRNQPLFEVIRNGGDRYHLDERQIFADIFGNTPFLR